MPTGRALSGQMVWVANRTYFLPLGGIYPARIIHEAILTRSASEGRIAFCPLWYDPRLRFGLVFHTQGRKHRLMNNPGQCC